MNEGFDTGDIFDYEKLITVNINPRFWECYTCFGCECETKTEMQGNLVIFQDMPIIEKVTARASLMCLNIGLHRKIPKIRTTPVLVSYPKHV